MIFFFYVKFAFFGVIFKTPSSGQNWHEVNQSWTLPMYGFHWSEGGHNIGHRRHEGEPNGDKDGNEQSWKIWTRLITFASHSNLIWIQALAVGVLVKTMAWTTCQAGVEINSFLTAHRLKIQGTWTIWTWFQVVRSHHGWSISWDLIKVDIGTVK